MCKILLKLLMLLGIALAPAITFAQETAKLQPEDKPTYCPAANKLVKEELWWHADGFWKSYSESFVDKVDRFIGAQWIGVQVGTIICLYEGKNNFDFPVALEPVYTLTVLAPTGASWQTTKEGYKKCVSNDVLLCPFYKQKSSDNEDLYGQIKYTATPGAEK
jgi:hypothetical protein